MKQVIAKKRCRVWCDSAARLVSVAWTQWDVFIELGDLIAAVKPIAVTREVLNSTNKIAGRTYISTSVVKQWAETIAERDTRPSERLHCIATWAKELEGIRRV